MIKISNKTKGAVLFHQSSQNIDRIVSFYKASLISNRKFVVDIYTAHILNALKNYADIPYPSKKYSNVKVFYPYWLSDRIAKKDKELLFKFSNYKITNEEIAKNSSEIMMMVRTSMLSDLKMIDSFNESSYVYSLWTGYLKEDRMKKMLDYINNKNIKKYRLHTSGHASKTTLDLLVNRIQPKKIVPIHTFHPEEYKNLFESKIVETFSDGELIEI